MFEYEYDGERKLSNPSKTSKLGKSEAGPKLVAYNTLDGELMELIESSYEEAFDHDDVKKQEHPLSFNKTDAQIKRGNHSGKKVKVERKGALGANRRRNEQQKEGGQDYQDDHEEKRAKKKKKRRKGGVDYQDESWRKKCSLRDLGTKKEEKQVDIPTKKKK